MKKILYFTAAALLLLSACKNDSKPNAAIQPEQPKIPVLTQEQYQQEKGKVHAMRDSLDRAIKDMDKLLDQVPKATAAKASVYLENLQGMQEKAIILETDMNALGEQVKVINSPAGAGGEGAADAPVGDVHKAIEEINVSRQSLLETIRESVDSIKAITGKKQ